MTSTKSRATRAAEAAEADAIKAAESGEIEPTTEAAEAAAQAAIKSAEAAAQGKDEPKPEKPSLPAAQLNPGSYPYWMFRPSVTGPDGIEHECEHRDGHSSIKSMMTCARSLGRESGLTVPDPDPSTREGGPGERVS